MESSSQMNASHKGVDTKGLISEKLTERKKREEQIHEESKQIDNQVYVNLHFNNMELSRGFQSNWNLYFDVDLFEDRKMLKQLSHFVMPPGSSVLFCNRSLVGRHMKEFLSKSVPAKIRESNAFSNKFDKSPSYFNLILNVSMHTTAKFTLRSFENLNMKQLKRLFSASKHTKSLIISHCTLCLPASPDFSDCFRGATLSELKLCYVKVVNRNEADEHLHELDGLISGLSKSPDLHKSIKRIEIDTSRFFNEQNSQVVAKYGFPYK